MEKKGGMIYILQLRGKKHAVTCAHTYMDPSYNTQMCEVEFVDCTYFH